MNKKVFFTITVYLLSLFVLSSFQDQQDFKVLFEKAKYTMETKGDLPEAIQLFEAIIKDFPEEKEYAANSQLLIGICFEKMGHKSNQQAREAFQKVVSKYPAQDVFVKVAREKLALLSENQITIEKSSDELKIRKVWAEAPEVYGGGVSPNGRYVSYINWNTAEIEVHDLITGKTWNITNEGNWSKDKLQGPDASIWSPDSRKIAYWWYYGGNEKRTELRIQDINGGEYKVLAKGERTRAPYPLAWSKDGERIWAVDFVYSENLTAEENFADQKSTEMLVTVSVKDGGKEKMHSLKKGGHSSGRFSISPDDKHFVYDMSSNPDTKNCDIHMFTAENKNDIIIAEHPAHDWAPQWSPDGKQILFLSKRTGNTALWTQYIKDGKAFGDPVMVQKDMPKSTQPIGISGDGSYYYGTSNEVFELYTAQIDLESGKLLSEPEKLSLGLEGMNSKPLFTPDGESLVYFSVPDPFTLGRPDTWIVNHNLESHEEKQFKVKKLWVGTGLLNFYPTLADNGRSVVCHRAIYQGVNDFVKVDLEDGSYSTLLESDSHEFDVGFWPRLSDDGKQLYYLSGDKQAIIKYDIQMKSEYELFRSEKYIHLVAFSPDLKQAVISGTCNELWLLSLEQGKAELLVSLEKDECAPLAVWSPDGKYVVFKARKSKKLYRIKMDGSNDLKECDLDMTRRMYIQVHPDGKTIVFNHHKGSYREVWAMENYLPIK